MGSQRRRAWLFTLVLSWFTLGAPAPARSQEAAKDAAWSEAFPSIVADVRAGKPLVAYVVVPLCDRAQLWCGSHVAGGPQNLATNIYWGAIFGARRMFDRDASGWEKVDRSSAGTLVVDSPVARRGRTLESLVYRRKVPGSVWGAEGDVEQIVVLEAVHGTDINHAVARFWALATAGGRVRFSDEGRERRVAIHVSGYAGHNRLMDGVRLPPAPPADRRRGAPSFVLACFSEPYFGAALREAGSPSLVMTRNFMAPEGYAIDAVVRGLGDNLSNAAVRKNVVRETARWQRIPTWAAETVFAKGYAR